MADYKELLRRAVEALPENNGAARRAVYEKARAALVGQLRAINPPLPARDITTHRLQLEDCIRQVEQEASEANIAGMGVSFMSGHAVAQDVQLGNLALLDVDGFPARRHWFIVHRSTKRLPPVALAFKEFLLAEGAEWLAQTMRSDRRGGRRAASLDAAKQR